jgi:hypothetical protein
MSSTAIPEALFLDTQVFVATGFNFKSSQFAAMRAHLSAGRLRMVTTDITVREVKARIAIAVHEELARHSTFRKGARVVRNSLLPAVVVSLAKLDEKQVVDDLCGQFQEFLKETKAEVVDTDDVQVAPVFEKYFGGAPPFGHGDSKKSEFPDAFVLQALREWTEDRGEHLFVVSGDDLFRDGCGTCDELHAARTLAEVLDHVASDDKKLAGFIRSETAKRADDIANDAKSQFEDRLYWVADEEGDAEVEVANITATGDPEIIQVTSGEAIVQMTFRVTYNAHLSYTDSSTGVWDSEDGRMMFMEHREEDVEREEEVVVEVRVVFMGTDPEAFGIEDVDLTEPADGFAIKTEDAEDWPYK